MPSPYSDATKLSTWELTTCCRRVDDVAQFLKYGSSSTPRSAPSSSRSKKRTDLSQREQYIKKSNEKLGEWYRQQASAGAVVSTRSSSPNKTSTTTVDRTNQRTDESLRRSYRALQDEVKALLDKVKDLELYAQDVEMEREDFNQNSKKWVAKYNELFAKYNKLKESYRKLLPYKEQYYPTCNAERVDLKKHINILDKELRELRRYQTSKRGRGVLNNLMRRRRRTSS